MGFLLFLVNIIASDPPKSLDVSDTSLRATASSEVWGQRALVSLVFGDSGFSTGLVGFGLFLWSLCNTTG